MTQRASSSTAVPGDPESHLVWGRFESNSDSSGSGPLGATGKHDNVVWRADNSSDTTQNDSNNAATGSSESCDEGPRSAAALSKVRLKETKVASEHEALAAVEGGDDDAFRDLSEEQLAKVVPWVDGHPLSLGSRHHAAKSCVPCAFCQKPKGCKQGIHCGFCHFPHAKEDFAKKPNRPRPCKGSRMRFKDTFDRLKEQVSADPGFDTAQADLPPSISGNADKKEKLKKALEEHRRAVVALSAVDKYQEEKHKLSL